MRKKQEKFLLYISVCIALTPILLFRDFTPGNELRYLSIADEALRTPVFFAFTNHGIPYADKPPLYFWIIMLCKWITGDHHIWLLSLFSLLPALGIVQIMDQWTLYYINDRSHLLAELMLLTSVLFIGAAVTLRMDILMCFFIILSLHRFWMIWKKTGNIKWNKWLFPLFIFLSVFTKGPLGLLIPFFSTTLFLFISGSIKHFFRYWGWYTWSILSICFLLWFSAVYIEGGVEYLYNLLIHQTIDRAVNSFHHSEPFYYYTISIWYSIAPWSLLILSILATLLREKLIHNDLQHFFLCIIITIFLLLSCISSKLHIYLLPIIPFLIYFATMFLSHFYNNSWIRITLIISAILFTVAFPVLLIISSNPKLSYLNENIFYIASIILTLNGIYSQYLLYKKKKEINIFKVIRQMGIGILLTIFIAGWTLPKLNLEIGYGTLCKKALELSSIHCITNFYTWHISRSENMDVYLQHPIHIIKNNEEPLLNINKPFLLLTRKSDLHHFPGKETHTIGRFAVVIMSIK
ncbi:MAG: dolichyl-phosphate-mannose--protein mannosyltransferase [Clostridia bacterium]|nr:dolichyl-phosphate-mannose--protein mannosyltransferase [Clostridia bacterium]MDD4376392.1 dolichyl-phosphate-mannose--protein mannosyltransferase [Clostridia bacterium]